jgi:hypothetical protein
MVPGLRVSERRAVRNVRVFAVWREAPSALPLGIGCANGARDLGNQAFHMSALRPPGRLDRGRYTDATFLETATGRATAKIRSSLAEGEDRETNILSHNRARFRVAVNGPRAW